MKQENLIQTLSFEFALSAIEIYKKLIQNHEYVISKQLLRSATSIGANIEEALAAYSKKEFVSKMSIASKEAREARYWLRLLHKSQIVEFDYSGYLNKIEGIVKILTKIVKTSQESLDLKF